MPLALVAVVFCVVEVLELLACVEKISFVCFGDRTELEYSLCCDVLHVGEFA